tara:strand:- start:1651 stop:1863 length:213 start_codon:yes stop_codon:yes gene_type:complete
MAQSFLQGHTDKHLETLENAYHATVEAFLIGDTRLMTQGLGMLERSVREAISDVRVWRMMEHSNDLDRSE